MTISYLEYPLMQGYIHNWLVAGPQAIEVSDWESFEEENRELQIARHYHEKESGIAQTPVDRTSFQMGDAKLTWHYHRCSDDHFVDVSTACQGWHYLRTWAYSRVKSPSFQQATFILTTNGPADLWLNGEHVHRQEHFPRQEPRSVSFQVTLQEGDNEILVRFEQVAARLCPYVMALQIGGLSVMAARALVVRVPTSVERPERQRTYEHVFEYAYPERYVFYKGDIINLYWADTLDIRWNVAYMIQDARRRLYLDGTTEAKPGAFLNVGHPARLWERPYYITLQPMPSEYWEDGMRYERRIPIHVLDTPYAEEPYGSYGERRQEALENAAKRENDLFAEIAKCALGQWDRLSADTIMETIARIEQGAEDSHIRLLGLLGMIYRYGEQPSFPEKLRQPIEECILGFRYRLDELAEEAVCCTPESDRIILHACETLAGQLYPDRTFVHTGQRGQWHQEEGERKALSWLRWRGGNGFQEWDSSDGFAKDLLALSHLTDLAQNDQVSELAAVLMDKMFFTIAINSYKGAFGSTHGCTCTPMILSSQLEPTSGISRLMWGTGVFNHYTSGVVSLACSEYELPSIIAEIATQLPEEMWSQERHVNDQEQPTLAWPGPEVNKVTYKTPDYMLCSAQDYHPGKKGYRQHIWQATLGPDAVVFVNHPTCTNESDAHQPGYWCGNRILPRVAQWKDFLIAVHRLPEEDWLGFTHAYFPIKAFDEYRMIDRWAFARKGDGYLALAAAQGIELVQRGPGAYRELRSHGQHNVWVCQMGRAKTDGDFAEFQAKVLAMPIRWQELAVQGMTLRAESFSFGWEGPLVIDGKEQPITGFRHYDNLYCVAELPSTQMDIRLNDFLLRLDFA